MMKPLLRFSTLWMLVAAFTSTQGQAQHYEPQPNNKYSTLFGLEWEAITDAQFATMAKDLLIKNGSSNARSATFLFEQCFSGGMFNDLDTAFGNDLRWVGGSAARHDQSSYGEGNSAPFPMDHWVRALDQALDFLPTSLPMINHINVAREGDDVGPNGTGNEDPQSLYRNGGETINHRQGGGSGHYAILWAGNANRQRHVNDILVMYENLREAYMATGDPWSIIVLGDSADLNMPALSATKENLQQAFDAIATLQDPDADFLFFASNHGGVDTKIFEQSLIGLGQSLIRRVAISDSELDGILRTPEAIPGFGFQFEGLDEPGLRVVVDGIDLGDPFLKRDALGNPFVCIDRDVLRRIGPDFEIRLVNDTTDRVQLVDGFFRTGGINNAVPEAGTWVLILVGLSMCSVVGLRRRGQTQGQTQV